MQAERRFYTLVCGMLFLVYLPWMTRLPWSMSIAVVIGLLLRVSLAYGIRKQLPRALIPIFTVLALGFVYVLYGSLYDVRTAISLLALMLVIKTYESKTRQSLINILLLSYLLLLASYLQRPGLLWDIYASVMIGVGWIMCAQLIGVSFKRTLKQTAWVFVCACPLAILLWWMTPRQTGPAWSLLTPVASQIGFNTELTLGSLSNLQTSNQVAFRVQGLPAQQESAWYWRMLVLNSFDGRTWRREAEPVARQSLRIAEINTAQTVHYEILLEPHQQMWLPLLDVPQLGPDVALMTSDKLAVMSAILQTKFRYQAMSLMASTWQQDLSTAAHHFYLKLPLDADPKTQQWAKEQKAKYQDDATFLAVVLDHIQQQGYRYTWQPQSLGEHAIDDFWFRTKEGFCEHYASALAVIMRAAGIPSRIVVGYRGGMPSQHADYWIVRQMDAHAWNEVWLAQHGWVRVDATAAIASSQRPQATRTWSSWDTQWDHWQYQWEQGLHEAQTAPHWIEKVKGLGHSLMQPWLYAVGLLGALILGGWKYWQRHRREDAIARNYRQLCHKLAKLGIPRAPEEGPLHYLERVLLERPDLKELVSPAIQRYIHLRFRSQEESSRTSS